MIDYHLHTTLCNHATGSMVQYIEKAIEKGLDEICFLDHLTIDESGKTNSMDIREVPIYLQSVRDLEERYRHEIKVMAGLEIDFNRTYVNMIEDVVGSFAFDLIGSSVHFVNGVNIASRRAASTIKEKNIDLLYGAYLEKIDEMLEYDFFDVACHLDVIKKNRIAPSRSFENEFRAILEKAAERGKAVECNTGGYSHPAAASYPSETLIKACSDLGIGMTLGSDAHNPGSVARNFERAVQVLREAGHDHLVTFHRRAPGKMAL